MAKNYGVYADLVKDVQMIAEQRANGWHISESDKAKLKEVISDLQSLYDIITPPVTPHLYKYVTWDERRDDRDEREFFAIDDNHAIEFARIQEDAQLDEMERPYVLKQHESKSNYGCGYDSCILCGGWHYIVSDEPHHGETVHGNLIKDEK